MAAQAPTVTSGPFTGTAFSFQGLDLSTSGTVSEIESLAAINFITVSTLVTGIWGAASLEVRGSVGSKNEELLATINTDTLTKNIDVTHYDTLRFVVNEAGGAGTVEIKAYGYLRPFEFRAVFDAHDAVGGTVVNGTESQMPLTAVRLNGDTDNYSLAANVVTIQKPGNYLVGLHVSGAVRASGTYAMEGWLRVNSTEVALTRSRVRIGAT